MQVFYVDESGCLGALPAQRCKIQPAFVLGGIIVDVDVIESLTRGWIDLKQKFFPGRLGPDFKRWDWHRLEIKGSDLRRTIRSGKAREARQTIGFIDKTSSLLKSHNAHLLAKVYIKEPGGPFGADAVYTSAIQQLCSTFEAHLANTNQRGLMIADSRSQNPNNTVSHSVFTMKYRAKGDAFPRLMEPPVFGHSINHSGLQLSDILCSGLLFPICVYHFLYETVPNSHVHGKYHRLAERYTATLQSLQLRLPSTNRTPIHGIVVSNPVTKTGAASLFKRFATTAP